MPTVLVIEDNWQNRQLIKTMLEFEGYAVKTAGNMAAAWDVLGAELPDVICCDLMMPGTNGFDFLASRREIHGLMDVPVVAVSGNYLEKAEVKALGAFAYLYKPFGMSQLLSTVESALVAARQ
jgi:two-component system nitrogen regulation response regulator GlnG